MRSIVIPIGGYTYVFSAVLTIYLLGNVVGAGIGSWLSKRLVSPATGFGISLTCVGLFGIVHIPWLGTWHLDLGPQLLEALFGGLRRTFSFQAMGLPLFYSTLLFFIPSLTMGVGFPLALQAWSNYVGKVGQTTGTVYGANTIGSVLGGVMTGFVLIPLLGAQVAITVLGLAGILLGGALIQLFAPCLTRLQRAGILALAVGLTITTIFIPSDLFERRIVSTPGDVTLAAREGVTTTVAVKRTADGTLILTSDGVHVAGDGLHRSAQKMLGHLGVLLNTTASDVLTVGFGSGETSDCLARHGLNCIDCVEIAPELVEVALEYFGHLNLGAELDHHVRMIYMDAKNYLHLTDRKYDIIINDADIPSYAGSAPIFAREHFQSAADHLNPGGLFITKLHLTGISLSSFDSILGTLLQVFPYTTVWFPTTKAFSFFYLVGAQQEQMFSPRYVEGELSKEGVRESVAYLNYSSSHDLFSCYLGDQNDIRRYLREYKVNSDYRPFVEFNLEQRGSGLLDAVYAPFLQAVRRGSLDRHLDWSGMSDGEREQWERDQERHDRAASYLLKLPRRQDSFTRMASICDGLRIMPDHPALRDQERKGLVLAQQAVMGGMSEQLLAGADAFLVERPQCGSVWLIRSWALERRGDINGALKACERAEQYAPDRYLVHTQLGRLLLRLDNLEEAVEHYEVALELEPQSAAGHGGLARVLVRQQHFRSAISHYREALRIDPDRLTTLNGLAWLLATCRDASLRDAAEAIRLSERACELAQGEWMQLDTKAVAYAAAGRYTEAVATAEEAIRETQGGPGVEAVREMRVRLELFKAQQPYVEEHP